MTHQGNRSPFSGSGRLQEAGFLGTHKQDFNSHWQGGGYRHGALDVDMEPSLTGTFSDPTVQGTLDKLATFVKDNIGGFISIGDGYTSGATINIGDPGITTIEEAFTEAFTKTRLLSGGIILLTAGVYRIKTSITIPAGISVMGELGGTVVVGETTEQPMFIISDATNRPSINEGVGSTIEPIDACRFFNLMLVDNLDGYVESLGSPIATMTTVPMIRCTRGSHLTCDQVSFFGRMETLTGSGRPKTLAAVGVAAAGGSVENTTLVMQNCVIDNTRIGIDFNPNPSAVDNQVIVEKCKVRFFGTDDSGSVAPKDNCFLSITNGSARIANNYVLGFGTYTESLVTVASPGSIAFMSIVGNIGSLEGTVSTGTKTIVDDSAGSTYQSVIAGNSFDNRHFQNEWFLTVGDGTTSIGDLTGPLSLNRILTYSADDQLETTVVVNRGSYTISAESGTSANVNLVGNPGTNNAYPLVQLNMTVGGGTVDYLSNRFVRLRNVKNIHFRNISTTTPHSVVLFTAGDFAHTVEVDGCEFANCTLIVERATRIPLDEAGRNTELGVRVRNCHFIEDLSGTSLTNNVAILLPPANTVALQDCVFRGSGYIGGIGEFTSAIGEPYTHAALTNVNILVDNCIMDISGKTITGHSPAGVNRYFKIESDGAHVTIQNSQILSSVNTSISGISNTFYSFVDIRATSVKVLNSTIVGPYTSFVSGGRSCCSPALRVTALAGAWVDGCKLEGLLPFQASGGMTDLNNLFGVSLTNSEFLGLPLEQNVSLTACDIDLEFVSPAGLRKARTQPVPRVIIDGCSFFNQLQLFDGGGSLYEPVGSSSLPMVAHQTSTSDYYKFGCVQIYANGFDINVTNCDIKGSIFGLDGYQTTGTTAPNLSGLIIDGYALNGGTPGELNSRVSVSNNTIVTFNPNHDASLTDSGINMNSVRVIAPFINISNNYIGYSNEGTHSNVLSSALYLENRVGEVGPNNTAAIVTGNTIDNMGAQMGTSNFGAFVAVDPNSDTYHIVDNVFTSTSADGGASTITVIDWNYGAGNGYRGVVERNVNQTETARILSYSGVFTIDDHDAFYYTTVAAESKHHFFQELDGDLLYTVEDGSDLPDRWMVDLTNVLPYSVYIISVSTTITESNMGGGSGATLGIIRGASLPEEDGPFKTGTISVEPANPKLYRIVGFNDVRVYVDLSGTSAGTGTYTLTPIQVVYRW